MLVSVLLPVYNVAPYLSQCLDSILNQTYGDLQIVLVDDGSTDNSWQICREYAARDQRVEIYHQENQGVAVARNALLTHANGNYVLFIDSDDWIEPDMVSFLVGQATATGCTIVTCGMVVNDTPVKKEYTVRQREHRDVVEHFLFHRELTGSLWNKLLKRSLLHGLQFNPEVSYGEDALFCWQVFLRCKEPVLMTTRQLYHYRMNDNSISHSFGKLKFTAYKVWQAITSDTECLYPELLPVAQGKFCSEMTIVLYNAARNGYPADAEVSLLCGVLRRYSRVMHKVGLSSMRKYLMALALGRSYRLVSSVLRLF